MAWEFVFTGNKKILTEVIKAKEKKNKSQASVQVFNIIIVTTCLFVQK
jgi:hypothetical protein